MLQEAVKAGTGCKIPGPHLTNTIKIPLEMKGVHVPSFIKTVSFAAGRIDNKQVNKTNNYTQTDR